MSLALDLADLAGCELRMALQQLPPGEGLRAAHLAAAVSRAFCQSALNWTMPLSVSG